MQKKSVASVMQLETMKLLRIALPRWAWFQAASRLWNNRSPGRNGGVEASTSSWVWDAATRVQYSGSSEPMPTTVSAMYAKGPPFSCCPAPGLKRLARFGARCAVRAGRTGAGTLVGLVMVMDIAPGQTADLRTKRPMSQLTAAMISRRASIAQATAAAGPRCPRFQP